MEFLWIKLVIAYDGSRFKGWQKGNGRTVQDVLEQALLAALPRASSGAVPPGIWTGSQLQLVGAGRTDAGVHAEGQVASAVLPVPGTLKGQRGLFLDGLLVAVNEELPPDMAVRSITEAPPRFHARYHTRSRTYRYTILNGPAGNPFRAAYSWHIPKQLDIPRMKEAASFLTGTKDFTSLTADKSKSNRVRTLSTIRFEEIPYEPGGFELNIFYTADSFLWNQVRIMTNLLVQVGLGNREPADVRAILETRNRAFAPEPAPARGLCLVAAS
ncbi:MAG: tRNA pseudouridine(38-40) synthase TruA [Termitinemataceae bacterium]